MLGQMSHGLIHAHPRRRKVRRDPLAPLQLLPHAPVLVTDEAFQLRVTDQHECPILQIPAARRVNAGVNNFLDRKSTRLNSSHSQISYAVFCLKKKSSTWAHL